MFAMSPIDRRWPLPGKSIDHEFIMSAFWILGLASGEAVFVGDPKMGKSGKVLILATDPEIGFEIDAEDCRRTGLTK